MPLLSERIRAGGERTYLQAFLGARWSDSRLICNDCQKSFAKGVDLALSERLQPFRLLLGTAGDHGGTGSPLKKIKVSSGETIDLGPRGQVKIVEPYIEVFEEGDKTSVQMKLGRKEDIGWGIHEVGKLLPGVELDSKEIEKRGVHKTERLDGEIAINFALGGSEFFRGVLKSCSNLFACHSSEGRAEFLKASFDGVRDFVLNGNGEMSDYARWITFKETLNIPKRGTADQAIVLTAHDGNVEGVIQFFGYLPFSVRLTSEYSGPEIRCAYIVDPYREADPAEQKLSGDDLKQYDEYVPLFDEQSPVNNTDVQSAWNAAVNRFMAHHIERENEETLSRIVDEVRRQNPKAAAMSRDDVEKMARKATEKRFKRYEESGDASDITVFKIQSD